MRTLYLALALLGPLLAAAPSRAEAQLHAEEQALDAGPTLLPTAHAPSNGRWQEAGPGRYQLLTERLQTRRMWGPALMTALGLTTGVLLVVMGFLSAFGNIDCEDDCSSAPFGMIVGGGVAGGIGLVGAIFLIIRGWNRFRWREELHAIQSGYALASPR